MAYQKGRKNEPWRVHWKDYNGKAHSIVRPTKTQARSLLKQKRQSDPNAWMERA